MARAVIADTGPLIAFAGIDRLSILRSLFSEVSITESVKAECLVKTGLDAQRIDAALGEGWLVSVPVEKRLPPLSPSLGIGESDSIRFASQAQGESLPIVDDRLARRYALQKGLDIVGTVRLLDLAEQRGLMESAESYIREMSGFGYHISAALLQRLRQD